MNFPRLKTVPHPPLSLGKRLLVWGKGLIALVILALVFLPDEYRPPRPLVMTLIIMGLVISLVDAFADFRWMRPRGRMRYWMALSGGGGLGLALAALAIREEHPDDRFLGIALFVTAALCIAASLWAFLRWRRLRNEARLRLWQLRQIRKKRMRL